MTDPARLTFTADQVRDMQRRTEGTLSEMLGAYAALLEASGWQPIETAPRDGTPMLLYSAAGGAMRLAEYGLPEPQLLHATHWMPLPAPPPGDGR